MWYVRTKAGEREDLTLDEVYTRSCSSVRSVDHVVCSGGLLPDEAGERKGLILDEIGWW